MPDLNHSAGLFPALLKHWRGQRGLSQLDLSLAAGVSARHISFLEIGRASPSAEMVLRLAATLGVPLRHANAMLEAAGHPPAYAADDEPLPAAVAEALSLLKAHQEPFPLLIIDDAYTILDLNQGAAALLAVLLGEGDAAGRNLLRLSFSPDGAQPYIANFDVVGRQALWRLQREALAAPDDGRLRALLDELLAMPTVPEGWRSVDLSVPSDPALIIHLRHGETELRFMTTVTAFQAPQNVSVEALRIEHWFPYDAQTAAACAQLSGAQPLRSM